MRGFLAVSTLGVFVDPFEVPAHPAVDPGEIPLCASILVSRPEPPGHDAKKGGFAVAPGVKSSPAVSAARVGARYVVREWVLGSFRARQAHHVFLACSHFVAATLFGVCLDIVKFFRLSSAHFPFPEKLVVAQRGHPTTVRHRQHVQLCLLKPSCHDRGLSGFCPTSVTAMTLTPFNEKIFFFYKYKCACRMQNIHTIPIGSHQPCPVVPPGIRSYTTRFWIGSSDTSSWCSQSLSLPSRRVSSDTLSYSYV